MRIALPVWDGRVSPVFEAASRIELHDIERGTSSPAMAREVSPGTAADLVIEHGADLVICSGISPVTRTMLRLAGVEVLNDVCGRTGELLAAYAAGDTELRSFRIPGRRARSARPSAGPRPQSARVRERGS